MYIPCNNCDKTYTSECDFNCAYAKALNDNYEIVWFLSDITTKTKDMLGEEKVLNAKMFGYFMNLLIDYIKRQGWS